MFGQDLTDSITDSSLQVRYPSEPREEGGRYREQEEFEMRYEVGRIVVLLCLMGTFAIPVLGNPPGMKVWVVGDSLRINPIDNRAYEENPILFPDSISGQYQESNLVWQASRKLISLRAARNEIIAFQIVVERLGEGSLKNVNVELNDFEGSEGNRISKKNLDLYREWYVKLRKRSAQDYSLGTGWYPDALLPCLRWTGNLYPHNLVHPFEIPDPLNNIGTSQRSQTLWVDLYVPRNRKAAPPGTYESTITISSDAGSTELTVRLKIWDFELPEKNHLSGNIHTNTEINTFSKELELKDYQMIRRHRLAMGVRGYAPKIEISGTDVKFDWAK